MGQDTLVSLDWSCEAHPGPPSNNLDVEVFNVGGFLTHGDYVLDADADFVAVVEHRLVPARARSKGKRLLHAGVRSVRAPASLEGGHVGHAGVGVVSLRGAPISLPTFATVGFSEFFSYWSGSSVSFAYFCRSHRSSCCCVWLSGSLD